MSVLKQERKDGVTLKIRIKETTNTENPVGVFCTFYSQKSICCDPLKWKIELLFDGVSVSQMYSCGKLGHKKFVELEMEEYFYSIING